MHATVRRADRRAKAAGASGHRFPDRNAPGAHYAPAVDHLTLLGSAGEPWPVQGCRCRHCAAGGPPRAPSALSVGPDLVLEGARPPGPHPLGPAASHRRFGLGPAAGDGPGPAVVLSPGERAEVGRTRIAALPAGDAAAGPPARPAGDPAVLVVVTPGLRLLWAPDTGPLPETTVRALEGAGLDLAVLDSRAPDGRCDPAAFGHRLSRLRGVGALRDGARTVAAGLCHEGAGPERLARALEPWGAQVLPDGAVLTGPGAVPGIEVPRPPARTLVLGGASSGKSALAEELLAAEPLVVYAATGPRPGPADPQWSRRVAVHRERRPPWWTTLESSDVPGLLSEPGPPVLLDSVGTWLTATMGRRGAWDDEPGWERRTREEMERMRVAWRGSARRVVAVCEDVGSGVVPATAAGRGFRDLAGRLGTALADESELVLLCVAGRAVRLDAPGAAGHLPGGSARPRCGSGNPLGGGLR